MYKFIVKLTRTDHCMALRPNLNIDTRFHDLFHENILQELLLSKDKRYFWMIMSINEKEEIQVIIKSIPLHIKDEAEIIELI